MYHYFETIINSRTGVPIIGAGVQVFSNSIIVPIFSDLSRTPIPNNMAISDADGMHDFYVDDGEYSLKFTLGAGVIKEINNVEFGPIGDEVNVIKFGARSDGAFNCAPAFQAAVASLPATGGQIYIPDGIDYRLDSVVTDGGKPIVWRAGKCQITGPQGDFAFDLGTNGSAFIGSGRGATEGLVRAAVVPPVMPVVTLTLTAGVVTGATIVSPGSGLESTPLHSMSASPVKNDAAIVPTIAGGILTGVVIVAGGSGYVSAPTVTFIGGGHGFIKMNEPQHCSVSGISIDPDNLPNVTGLYQFGGWYCAVNDIYVDPAKTHASAVGIVMDSHTLGVPGPTGSYGGLYVGTYTNIVTSRLFFVGHDSSTGTTLLFNTVSAQNIHIHGCVAVTFVNAVVQNGDFMFDFVNVDGIELLGGDMEGTGTAIKVRGSCNNIRANPLAYSLTGDDIYGTIGKGWDISFARTNNSKERLATGGNGSAGQAFQNVGWLIQHRRGVHFVGDTQEISTNIKLISATQGNLDDVSNGATIMRTTSSGQLLLLSASAGANPRDLVPIGSMDTGGMILNTMPSSNPGAGSKRLWYDPADGNRVKFAV